MKSYIYIILITLISLSVLSSCGGGATNNGGGSSLPLSDTAMGEVVYKKTCFMCHQANGEGVPGTFPPLAKSDYIADRAKTIRQVLKGSSGAILVNGTTYNSTMPPQSLSDEEIAQVLTYVYTAWGNSGIRITTEEVKAVKSKE